MHFSELLRFALRGLRRQKVRTLLTTVGVAVGACSLAFSVSLGFGLRSMIDREFRTRPGFWEISVLPGLVPQPLAEEGIPPDEIVVEGEFDAARAERIKRQLVQRYRNSHAQLPPATLTDESIARLAALPQVAEVVTARFAPGSGTWRGKRSYANVVSGRSDQAKLTERIQAGRAPSGDAAECAVSEMLLYDLGARSEADFQSALGSSITIELGGYDLTPAELVNKLLISDDEKRTLKGMLANARQPEREKPPSGTFTIVGIVRSPTESDDDERGSYMFRWTTVFTGGAASEAMYRQLPHMRDGHYENAEVKVHPGSDLPAVVASIEAMGFPTHSASEWFVNAKREVTLIGAGLNVFAIVSLLVAALGITNTLVTSVVERTREIGILKAIGATGSQVRRVFLIEGTLIGFFGGLLGLICARLLAGPADEFVRHQVKAMMGKHAMMTESVFDYPLWLSAATPLFAMMVTTLAALSAHRAARIAPIEALRYG